VDSPGGDSLASDLIWRAVARVRKEKPVIASYGDLAASGGYYASCGADRIFSEPTTLTGSIGVFTLHFQAQDLFDRIGINTVEEHRGKFSGGGLHRGLTDDEKAIIQKYVGVTYETFLSRVKDGRKLSDAEVREIAQGRVWTGEDAKKVGLVDELGGLADAIQAAKDKVGIGGDDSVEIRVITGKDSAVARWGKALNVTMQLFSGEKTRQEQMRQAVGFLLGDPDMISRAMMAKDGQAMAMMPYTVQVK